MDSDMGPSYPQPPPPDISANSDQISAGSGSSVAGSPSASHGGPKKRVLTSEEEEAKAQRKREQAAERQRRKREKDRLYGRQPGPARNHFRIPGGFEGLVPDDNGASSSPNGPGGDEDDDRRERVRAAARERQRKHRALVKQRKSDGNSSYSPTPPPSSMFPPMGPQTPNSIPMQQSASSDQPQTEIPFPIPSAPVPGGQTFATTLLLSFSCAPLLKQHLLNTLNMSNEELASLEPVIADAWEWWNHQRQMHHELMANGGQPPPLPPAPLHAPPHAQPVAPAAPNSASASVPQATEQVLPQASQPGFRVVAGPATVTPPAEETVKT